LEPDDRLHARRRLARVAVAPAAVVAHRAAFAAGRLAHGFQFLRVRVAAIGLAGREQFFRHLAMPAGAGELMDRLAVPGDAEPGEAIDDRVDRGFGRALAV